MMKKIFTYASCITMLTLCYACNTTKGSGTSTNPFFVETWDTPFAIPPFDQIKPEHFIPAYQEGIRLENEEIKAIIENTEAPNFENTIAAYASTGEFSSRVSGVFYNLTSAEITDTLRTLQAEIIPMLTAHSNEITLNGELFNRIKSVYDNRASMNLSAEQLRLTEKIYEDFTMNGANLSDEQKEKLKKINQNQSSLSLAFGNNLLKEMNDFELVVTSESDLEGLSQTFKDASKIEGEQKWVFNLSSPSMIPFLQSAKNRELRQKLYEGYLNRCNYNNDTDNKEVINFLVNTRIERAKMLGFDSHADYILKRNMAENPKNVYDLLDELWTPALKTAELELKEMKQMKFKDDGSKEFESWDWWYYAERLREQKYNLNDDEIRPYLSLDATREGIFTLCNKLWGVTFVPVENAPVYNEECQVYECLDKDGTHLGVINMDFFPRKGKRVGAWCSSFRGQTYKDGKRVAPLSTIVCNFTRPVGNEPALLNITEVITFFHEFGHGVHTLLSDVKTNGLKRVSRDFVELPSQLMENWAMSPELLRIYAKHYKTGEVIPEVLIKKIQNAALFNQGFKTVEYLAASYLDMNYHTLTDTTEIYANEFEIKAMDRLKLMDQIAPRYRSTYFQHIFSGGYSAGYYAYIWAEVLDKDAYQAFVETGDLFNQEVAQAYRKNVLEAGGTKQEMELYKGFRGKEPEKAALLRSRGFIQ